MTMERELSKNTFSFENNEDGFRKPRDWAVKLAAKNFRKQIVLGLEPTGPCSMDGLKRDQRGTGKTDKRGGGQQPAVR